MSGCGIEEDTLEQGPNNGFLILKCYVLLDMMGFWLGTVCVCVVRGSEVTLHREILIIRPVISINGIQALSINFLVKPHKMSARLVLLFLVYR